MTAAMKRYLQGANVTPEGVGYCVWAPEMHDVSVEVLRRGAAVRRVPLAKDGEGYHSGLDPEGRAGDAYGFRIGTGPVLPDTFSRGQAESVHGLSLVVDPAAYKWADASWQRPAFRDLVIYELHVGTFSREGTYLGAIPHLPYLKSLGVTAIEIMPIADFPGRWNWGYDGVLLYAPARCYGSPDDLRALVDAAHASGIAVLLDVVYNHFGPDGNYVSAFSPLYFHPRHHTPWGNGFNVEHPAVRTLFLRNPVYWMEEFHIDGFRFDATHEIQDDSPTHLLAELTDAVHARGGYAIAEDARNEVAMITDSSAGGLGFDAVWADDLHHTLRVSQTRESHSYFGDFSGKVQEVVETLTRGWLFSGQFSKAFNGPRGTDASHIPPQRFLHCISNHDQTGNRALGERLNQQISAASYRALSALLCLTPGTPMLFMGQEWASSSPFLFFTDHNEELGKAITKGRRKEFSSFPGFADPEMRKRIPDPQKESTFADSKLRWEEIESVPYSGILALYREFIAMRQSTPAFRPAGREGWRAGSISWGAGFIRSAEYLVLFSLSDSLTGSLDEPGNWQPILSSEEFRFGGDGPAKWDASTSTVTFIGPETIVFRRED